VKIGFWQIFIQKLIQEKIGENIVFGVMSRLAIFSHILPKPFLQHLLLKSYMRA
jgi:hypothetical protein